jgi:hypothetical protein
MVPPVFPLLLSATEFRHTSESELAGALPVWVRTAVPHHGGLELSLLPRGPRGEAPATAQNLEPTSTQSQSRGGNVFRTVINTKLHAAKLAKGGPTLNGDEMDCARQEARSEYDAAQARHLTMLASNSPGRQNLRKRRMRVGCRLTYPHFSGPLERPHNNYID